MSEPTGLAWIGDVQGHLETGGDAPEVIGSTEALLAHAHAHGGEHPLEEAELFGALALFLRLRETRVGAAGRVLTSALRPLAAGPVFADPAREAAYRAGIEALGEHLEPLRNEPHHVLAYQAFLYLEQRYGPNEASEPG